MNSEFIIKVRKVVRRLSYLNSQTEEFVSELDKSQEDLDEISLDLNLLIKESESTIRNKPEIGLRALIMNYREIKREYDYSKDILEKKLSDLVSEGKDEYYLDFYSTREVISKMEEALGLLLELLIIYFPDSAAKNKKKYKEFLPNKVYLLQKDELSQAQGNKKEENPTKNQDIKKNFTANEFALAYIFDLWANGNSIPTNRVEGGNDAKAIKRIGEDKGFKRPDTFYRGVINVLKYDLNSSKQLENISKDWLNSVEALSTNWGKTKEYLTKKNLIRD